MKAVSRAIVFYIASLLSFITPASATTYFLSDVTFSDGGTAFGSFTTMFNESMIYPVDITTTAGTALPGAHYGDGSYWPNYGSCTALPSFPGTGCNLYDTSGPVQLFYSLYLSTNSPGPGPIIYGGEQICFAFNCRPVRTIVSGEFTLTAPDVAPVPSPIVGAGLPGIVAALAGLIGWRRSRFSTHHKPR
jgi:hypothetical protein